MALSLAIIGAVHRLMNKPVKPLIEAAVVGETLGVGEDFRLDGFRIPRVRLHSKVKVQAIFAGIFKSTDSP